MLLFIFLVIAGLYRKYYLSSFGVRYGICNRCTDTVTWICSVHDELFRQYRMIMKTKDVFQRKWITDSITKRRYPFQIPSMTGRLHIYHSRCSFTLFIASFRLLFMTRA